MITKYNFLDKKIILTKTQDVKTVGLYQDF